MTWLLDAWSWFVGTKIGRWIVGVALVIGALAVGALAMFQKGKHAQAGADEARAAQSESESAQQVIKAANVRKDVVNEVETLPVAPPQNVATADPATAAGQLRDDGWVRPSIPDGH